MIIVINIIFVYRSSRWGVWSHMLMDMSRNSGLLLWADFHQTANWLSFVDTAVVVQRMGVGGTMIKREWGWGLKDRGKKEQVPSLTSCTFKILSSHVAPWKDMCLVRRWASFPPPPPLESSCLRAIYPFELWWEAAFLWGLESGVFGRLLEVPGHAFFIWCDVKLTFVWWIHTWIQTGLLGWKEERSEIRSRHGGKVGR